MLIINDPSGEIETDVWQMVVETLDGGDAETQFVAQLILIIGEGFNEVSIDLNNELTDEVSEAGDY